MCTNLKTQHELYILTISLNLHIIIKKNLHHDVPVRWKQIPTFHISFYIFFMDTKKENLFIDSK